MDGFTCSLNHHRVARIARKIAKPLSVGDIEFVVSEGMTADELEELCSAVDPESYKELKKKEADLEHRLELLPDEEAKKLCGEYWNVVQELDYCKTLGWFHLGFQSALKLLGEPPEMHVVDGGAIQRKRVAR